MSDGFNIDALLENLNYEEISELSVRHNLDDDL